MWVAGSTHAGEEEIIARVYQRLRKIHPDLFLILVPRHPERARLVAEELSKMDLYSVMRTALPDKSQPLQAGQVLIVDTIGEMLKLYSIADLVFVGGSMVGVGGHNILEASLLKKPVFFGSHMHNFKEIARLVRAAHGGLQVKDANDLYQQMKILIENPSEAHRIGENGHHLLEENSGATLRTLEEIERRILD